MQSARNAVLQVLDRLGARARLRNVLLDIGVKSWTPLVPEQEFVHACRSAIDALRTCVPDSELGDYLEFGVSRGTSLSCMAGVLADRGLHDVRMIGFDSFAGMPAEAAREGWAAGDFRSTISQTRAYLTEKGVDMSRVTLVPGWFSDTLNATTRERLALERASIIMVDCDIYSASRDALRFCASLIHRHAVIIFDDWGLAEGPAAAESGGTDALGQREAFAELLAERSDLTAVPLDSYRPESRVFLLTTKKIV